MKTDETNAEKPEEKSSEQGKVSRREAIKKGVIIGGAAIAVAKWHKPIVDSIVVPAHAQTGSEVPITSEIPLPTPTLSQPLPTPTMSPMPS